jgi:integrase
MERVLVVDAAVSAGELRQTKTNRRRTVEIIPALTEALDRIRPRISECDELLAPGKRGQPLDIRNWNRHVFRPACKRAGVRATPYDGRHSFASMLIHAGQPLPYVTAALGHASATTTLNHYMHLMDAARNAPGVPMAQAVAQAREQLARAGVRPVCAEDNVTVLRASR